MKALTSSNGVQLFFNSVGHLHNEDGPAIITKEGRREYYRNNLRHREDGPAVMHGQICEFWLFGKQITKEKFDLLCQMKKTLSLSAFVELKQILTRATYQNFQQNQQPPPPRNPFYRRPRRQYRRRY